MSAADLRRAFDEAFTRPPTGPSAEESILAFRVGGDPFAVRLADLDGLHGRRRLMRLPDGIPGRRGVIGIRGRLVAVYSLAALLGYPTTAAEPWVMVCRGVELALAFAELEGQRRVDPADWLPLTEPGRGGGYARELIHPAGMAARAVLNVAALVAECGRRARLKEE